MSTSSTTTTPRAEMAFVVAGRIVIRNSNSTSTAQQQQWRALPFGNLASQAGGLPVELLASERDLVARSEALIADDLMTWEPLDDGASRITQH